MQGEKATPFPTLPGRPWPSRCSWNDLCVLCFLCVHPLVFIREKSTKRKILISTKRKEPQTAEIWEDAEGIIDSWKDSCF
jgi:hypothetical protein